ncbi:GABA-specific high-affinity permease [Orbilia oligospora]|uniref:GABA-specific high-affinity permease n=1 Tax=Orbilia oligospora TaxID=2813651 RepID=A0A7C8PRN3_ORBOL|nr:GABA-specific high-affinity permease [Orbilia oligospora]KAF3189237.1 GABA-specific high-affinity permease [Orbilia oligospora]KAF3267950.1 GABA-specific high-affinity permease [Orbilia oligospora]KAF3269680.1 GABA-specific high-affinity permease [Orbilia oligospora]KAF3294682.1 GABA-specific high-affinity permease [Orbilia oligospora]
MIRSPEILAKPDDAFALAKLGYQQELKRNFSKLEILSVAFSILGLLPSIASSLVFAIPAGPVGMVWGWFIASGFTFLVSVAMADLGSAMPTAGGLYWWTHYFSAPGWKNPLAFLVGYSNTLGVISGLCSTDYGFALMFLSVVHLAVGDGKDFAPTSGTVYLVFIVCVLSHATIVTFASKIMAKLQVMFMVANVLLIAVTLIVLPVGKRNTNSAEWIFTHSENLSGWPAIWTFFLAWMCPIWSVGGFEACIHLSEEAQNATTAVPWGIMGSCGLSWILGTVIMIVFASSMTTDLESLLDSPLGQPVAQIYYDALGKNGAIAMMILLFINQWLMGASVLVAASRQSWAFSRDGALPFASFFNKISKEFGYVPVRTIWGCAGCSGILGLFSLIAPAAASALFSIGVVGNHLAWFMPIFARIVWGRDKFIPGPFYTGGLSIPIAVVACIFLIFSILTAWMPIDGPNVTPQNMNYAIVVNFAVWGGALLYYYIDARKWFTGPRITLDSSHSQLTEEQEEKIAKEALVDIRH